MPFKIIRNDIIKVSADAIVNTANPKPVIGTGVDIAIYKAAGEDRLLEERKKIGEIQPGEAKYTPAFDLDAKYIIHTAGPIWIDGSHDEIKILRSCYMNSLNLADELGCRSVAFPLIATGNYGFPKDKALNIATSSITEFLMEHDMEVIVVVFDDTTLGISLKVFDDIKEAVSSSYVADALKAEYGYSNRRGRELAEIEFQRSIARNNTTNSAVSINNTDDLFVINSKEKNFQTKLFEYIETKGLKNSEVYKPFDVSKQTFSRIYGEPDYRPNKYVAIALCMSLKLDLEQTEDMLQRAGYAFSSSCVPDLVLKECIKRKIYNYNVNFALANNGCPELKTLYTNQKN